MLRKITLQNGQKMWISYFHPTLIVCLKNKSVTKYRFDFQNYFSLRNTRPWLADTRKESDHASWGGIHQHPIGFRKVSDHYFTDLIKNIFLVHWNLWQMNYSKILHFFGWRWLHQYPSHAWSRIQSPSHKSKMKKYFVCFLTFTKTCKVATSSVRLRTSLPTHLFAYLPVCLPLNKGPGLTLAFIFTNIT